MRRLGVMRGVLDLWLRSKKDEKTEQRRKCDSCKRNLEKAINFYPTIYGYDVCYYCTQRSFFQCSDPKCPDLGKWIKNEEKHIVTWDTRGKAMCSHCFNNNRVFEL